MLADARTDVETACKKRSFLTPDRIRAAISADEAALFR
jgi:hypothetical protein